MAELVGCFAASHGPLLVREWAAIPAGEKDRLGTAFRELGRRVKAARPDVLIVVAPDHWSNFSLDNYPSICIGVGEVNEGPPEPFLKPFPHRELRGHPGLGMHILRHALKEGFEPSFSYRLKLDHGYCIPLWRMELEHLPCIVPMSLNSIEVPMPGLARCVQWGELLRAAIESYPERLRAAVLGTGGLSHSIGEPTMGRIDEGFDHECIRLFKEADTETLLRFLEKALPGAGNGSEEIRNWLVAHAAARGRGFELIDYLPVPTVFVGCGFASWSVT